MEFVSYGDEAELAEAVDDETAAVFLEPIQGEGGINPATAEYLQTARDLTEDAGAALVFDEIQTGMGRTGALWNSQRAAVAPDMLTARRASPTACRSARRSAGTGLPRRGVPRLDVLRRSGRLGGGRRHRSTIIEDSVPGNAAAIGDYLLTELEAAIGDDVRDIRGEGLMIGVEVGRGANAALKELALNHQVLALPAGRTVIRLLPPLTIDKDHADAVVDAMAEVVE